MEITTEQLEKLTCLVGEKALKLIIPNAFNEKFNNNKIYIYRRYKLHRVEDGIFAFIDMETSNCWARGKGSFEDMLKIAGNELKIFNSYEEYIKWAYKNEL